MHTRRTRLLLSAVGLALVAAAASPTASAAPTSTTLSIAGTSVGAPVDQPAVWYDNGISIDDPHDGTPAAVSLTVSAREGLVDVALTLGAGPVQPYQDLTAGSYRLEAFLRVDGASNTRGTHRLAGPVGTAAVAANDAMFPNGLTIRGTIAGVTPGVHNVTLTDLLVDLSTAGSGGFGGTPTGGDAYYNAGDSYGSIVTRPTDWPISQSVTVTADKTAPVVAVTIPRKPTKAKSWKTIKGTATDASGTKSVTVKLSQRRSDGSYIYNGKKWKKGKAGNAKAVAAKVSGSSWSTSITRPGKGKLTIKYSGIDKVGNTSAVKTYKTRKLT